MDEQLSKAVKESFIQYYDSGLIYRDNRLVNWSCKLSTAISDVELEYIDEDEKTHKQFYSAYDLAGALSTAMAKGYNHSPCGGKIDMDFSNYDSCVGDLLLQVMVYGELVYG